MAIAQIHMKPNQCKVMRILLVELREVAEKVAEHAGGWNLELREQYRNVFRDTVDCFRRWNEEAINRNKCRERCAALRALLWSHLEPGVPA